MPMVAATFDQFFTNSNFNSRARSLNPFLTIGRFGRKQLVKDDFLAIFFGGTANRQACGAKPRFEAVNLSMR
jgi:hypothetical protein